MARFAVVVALLLLSVGACAPKPIIPDRIVHWQGQEYREFGSLSDLPAPIRDELGASVPGLRGIADKGQPFNATDDIVEIAPMRRFITAGQSGDRWLVAEEVGGFGYFIRVSQFSGGKLKKIWQFSKRPETLEEILQQISSLSPDYTAE
jgi:hypothetical protein